MHTVLQIFLPCDPSKSILYFDSKPHIRILLACYSSNKIICIMFIGYVPPPITTQRAVCHLHTAPKIWNSRIPLHILQSQTIHSLPSDVILRRTTFFQPILPPSGPCNAPWFSSETLRYINLLLTYLYIVNGSIKRCQPNDVYTHRHTILAVSCCAMLLPSSSSSIYRRH